MADLTDKWTLEVACRCTNKRLEGKTMDDFFKDDGIKHPEVQTITGGKYMSLTWMLTPDLGKPEHVRIVGPFALSLN